MMKQTYYKPYWVDAAGVKTSGAIVYNTMSEAMEVAMMRALANGTAMMCGVDDVVYEYDNDGLAW